MQDEEWIVRVADAVASCGGCRESFLGSGRRCVDDYSVSVF